MNEIQALLCPPAEVVTKLTEVEREEVNWYHEMGMPISGTVVDVIRRATSERKENDAD